MSVFYKWGGGLNPDFPTVKEAYDEFIVTEAGEEIIDAASGAAVVNLGHSLSDVGDVMAEQANSVGYMSTSYFSNDPLETLAEKLEQITPDGLNSSFFVNSGSEANEAAIKLACSYNKAQNRPEKQTVIGRWQGYHGATLGALAVTGNTYRRTEYKPLLTDSPHIPPAYPYRWQYSGTPKEQAIAAAHELETTIKQEGSETVSAFIAEPVSGASIPAAHPHPAYYQEIRRICDEYDVLFIADEVMCGFGRTGAYFAMEHYDVVPDIMTLGKGLSAGYAPISAMVVHDDVAEEFDQKTENSFYHGHTYSGNPISCAVAAHVIEKYTPNLLSTARKRGELLLSELEPLQDHTMVGDIRHIGLMTGIEFVADTETKEPFNPELKVYKQVFEEAFQEGVYLYPGHGSVDGVAGDHIMISPPLTVSEESIERIAETTIDAITTVGERVR